VAGSSSGTTTATRPLGQYAPGAPGYTAPDLVGDAVGLIDAVAGGRAHVVGPSRGSGIAQYLAIHHGTGWPR
jgi:pimeloyl-ACP methyl ester carboxylesterase